MKRNRVRGLLAAGLGVATVITAGCGGDDASDDAATPAETSATDAPADDGDTASSDSSADDGDTASSDPSASDSSEPDDLDAAEGGDDENGDDAGPSGVGFECPDEDLGGDLGITTYVGTNTVSPYVLFGTGAVGGDYAAAIFDTIWRYDASTDTYSPWIGESLTNDDGDGTVWTLTLREGVTFGNGNPYTTEDVKAHIEALQQTALRAAGMTQLVENIEIIDDRTMTLSLSAPFNMEYFFSTEPGWVPDAEAVASAPEVDGTSQFGIDLASTVGSGAGPFEVEAVDPGERIVLRSKDAYWGGRACVDTLTYRYIPDTEAVIDSFELGEIDVMFISNNRIGVAAEEFGDLYFAGPTGGLDYLAADQGLTGQGETKWNDIRLREALQLAIDYDVLNERVYENLTPLTTSAIVPVESPLWTGVDGPPFDPDRASELVAEAAADGVDTSFTYIYAAPDEAQSLTLEAMWEAVGFDVTLEVVDSTLGRIIDKNFDVSTSGFATQAPAPWTTLNGLECGNVRQRTGYCDEEMDAALAELRGALNTEETLAALATVQEVWNRTFPVAITRHSLWGSGKQAWVGHIPVGPDANPYFHRVTVSE